MSLTPLITVFGATGAQGGGLARALLQVADRRSVRSTVLTVLAAGLLAAPAVQAAVPDCSSATL